LRMEANRDAAVLCVERAVSYFKQGNTTEAVRFARKAKSLFPEIDIPGFISLNNGDTEVRRRRSVSHSRNEPVSEESRRSRERSEEKSFTKAQVEAVRRIMACHDLYSVLGVPKDATEDDIKRAYKSLARRYHPDKNKAPGATEAFKKIGSAFNVLVDAEKRRRYDQFGTVDEERSSVTRRHEGVYTFDGNTGFDAEFINMFFNGGFPFAQNVRYTRHAQNHDSNHENNYFAYIQILPLLILFGLSFFSNFLVKDPVFSLQRTSKYTVQRQTQAHSLPYYVKDTFAQEYDGSIRHIENQLHLNMQIGALIARTSMQRSLTWLVSRNVSTVPPSERLWRSFLYVPGDQERKIKKMENICNTTQVSSSIPDFIVLDCEDAVSAENKALARKTIASSLQARGFDKYRTYLLRGLSLRINAPSTGLAADDLYIILSTAAETMKADGGVWPGPDYISVPKTESLADLHWVESQVMRIFQKHEVAPIPNLSLIGMIESASSLLSMRELCKEARNTLKLPLVAMVFGSDDYCASLGVTHSQGRQEALFARQYLVTMCKAYGLACLDMVETDLNNMEAFCLNCEFGAQLGYDGKQLIHPKQIEPANAAYAPSPERIEWATKVVEAAAAHTTLSAASTGTDVKTADGSALTAGAFAYRGHMIDRPTVRQAERVVALSKLMQGC
uniref:J domain-containing protein n=1 Tax=Taenia asiatica TaxID=60517 RepID=A0A0R3WBL3_TAEAS